MIANQEMNNKEYDSDLIEESISKKLILIDRLNHLIDLDYIKIKTTENDMKILENKICIYKKQIENNKNILSKLQNDDMDIDTIMWPF